MVVTGLSPLGSTAFDTAFPETAFPETALPETATPDMAPLVPLFAPYCGGIAQQSDLLKVLLLFTVANFECQLARLGPSHLSGRIKN